tara:strand:+ start:124 stop:1248 length:1125 start_codon:yes stop_codon:yes gene_type:complete
MSLILDGTNGITNLTSINGGQLGGRRNIVINGAMKVAQRSTSVAGLGAGSGYFTLDRYNMSIVAASAGRYTMAQVADGPAGFANCLKLTTTTADTSIAAGERLTLHQVFEGQDLQQLKKGTASAEQVTVSFYVKGNAAALYVCELYDGDNDRHISQSFAVTTAWNRIELTFAADTSDPLNDDNGASLYVSIWLHGGATYTGGTFVSNTWVEADNDTRFAVADRTSIFDSTDRTFFITGVQMEIGATATEFEHRSYGEELSLCQRYFHKLGYTSGGRFAAGMAATATLGEVIINFPTTMRISPTALEQSGTASDYEMLYQGGSKVCDAVPLFKTSTQNNASIRLTDSDAGMSVGFAILGRYGTSATGFLAWSADL